MSVEGGPDIVTDGLVLHLDAANNRSFVSGSTTWFDLSGNRNTGSLVNGPTYNLANNGGIVLDGTNDHIIVLNSNSINLSTNTTYAIWIKPATNITNTGQNGADVSFFRKQKAGSSNGFILEVYGSAASNKELCFWVAWPSGVTVPYNFTANVWYQIVGTYNGSVGILYVNGVQVKSASFTSTVNTSDEIHIGTLMNVSTPIRNYQGEVSNCMMYNRPLSAKEIRQNYNATKGRFGLF